MFAVTFLGHQGWVIRSGHSCVLVDPLLCENFGAIHALDYCVYPPRILRAENFPPIDAVVLSHEHDDHFDIPSLARLDRRIPIFMSARSSTAAFGMLRKMGFVARPLVPGVPIAVGDLDVVPFSGDHLNFNCADEWDALPYLIRDKGGAGSFFSMVDVMLVPRHIDWVRAYASRPGLMTWSNNALDWSHMGETPARDIGTEQCLRGLDSGYKLVANAWGKPSATLICAGGFTFVGERAWFNRRVFWVDTEAVSKQMSAKHRGEPFYSTVPGQTFWMEANRLTKVEQGTPFLDVAPRSEWPVRGRVVEAHAPDYSPATGRRELTAEDRAELHEGLQALAKALVGGILFRSLHSILAVEAMGRKPTFALVLRHGSNGAVEIYEYDAPACAFVRVEGGDARRAYVAGWECWATDFVAILRGDLGPIALMFGRARIWNYLSQRLSFDLHDALTRVNHPLSCPARYLRNYERLWEQSKSTVPTFAAASTAHASADVG